MLNPNSEKDWPSYGEAWAAYHQTTTFQPPSGSGSGPAPPGLPTHPAADDSELDWATYGRFIGAYHAALNQSQEHARSDEDSGAAWRAYGEALRHAAKARGGEAKREGWASYGNSWSEYGRAIGERYKNGPGGSRASPRTRKLKD